MGQKKNGNLILLLGDVDSKYVWKTALQTDPYRTTLRKYAQCPNLGGNNPVTALLVYRDEEISFGLMDGQANQ